MVEVEVEGRVADGPQLWPSAAHVTYTVLVSTTVLVPQLAAHSAGVMSGRRSMHFMLGRVEDASMQCVA